MKLVSVLKPNGVTDPKKMDPINDPNYNVREVVKNTILIEHHLSEPRRYCKKCLVKHFLLSIGLLEEAVWMAGAKIKKYPFLEQSTKWYQDTFKWWNSKITWDSRRLATLDKLRAWRQKMLTLYYNTKGTGK